MIDIEQKLLDTLIQNNFLTQDQVQVILEEQRNYQRKFSEICIQLGFIEPDIIAQTLAQITGIPYIDLQKVYIDWEIAQLIDLSFQKKHQAFLFSKNKDVFSLAMIDPEDLIAKDFFQQKLFQLTNHPPLLQIFHVSTHQLKEVYILAEKQKKRIQCANEPHSNFSDSHEIIKSVNEILQEAVNLNVSDIHFQPEEHIIQIRYRIDGMMHAMHSIHKNLWKNFSVRLKIMANLDIAESRRPQSGHFEAEFDNNQCDFRVSTHPTIDGENIVIRILYKNKKLLLLQQLGFNPHDSDLLLKTIQEPQGLFLICGPTGSGKTTTLYTLCANMDSNTRNIMTLEEPIEYKLENIRQTEIYPNGIMSFADGVRSILRQDPDVIFIGEIRDEDTAKIALRSAMTGHLVLSTLHANDIFRVPSRLFDLGIQPSLLSGQLLLIMSQRLVRKFCAVCHGKKCTACHHTGFQGRTVISEILPVDLEIDSLISEHANISQLTTYAKSHGFKTMYEDGIEKVEQKLTSLEELNRVLGTHH